MNKTFIRWISLVLVLCALAGTFVACDKDKPGDEVGETTTTAATEPPASDELTVNSAELSKFVIAYLPEYESIAISLKSKILFYTGVTPVLKKHSDNESECELVLGDLYRSSLKPLYPDSRYENYDAYEVKVTGTKVVFVATNENAMEAACDAFVSATIGSSDEAKQKASLKDGIIVSGTAKKPSKLGISARADGTEVRIACNNVYFYHENCDPLSVRKYTMCDSLYYMDADVILLQEVSTQWHSAMDPIMEELGYTVVPTRLNDGAVIGGGVSAQLNYTPIWYRAGVVELLDYGYDQFESVKLKPDSNHTTSKSFTWALFKLKSTGEQFIAISTHFTWAPADFSPSPAQLRAMDAAEIVEALEALSEKYPNVPAVVMGDLNSNSATQAYRTLAEVLTDARLTAKKKNNTEIGSSHTVGKYPTSTNVIDQTFYSKDGIDALQYQMIANEYSLNATDHIPMLFDIALK